MINILFALNVLLLTTFTHIHIESFKAIIIFIEERWDDIFNIIYKAVRVYTLGDSDDLVLIWSYLSCRHDSRYLRCPIRAQSDPAMRLQSDPHSDGTWHTSHNDCGRSEPKYMCATASSRCGWFGRQKSSKSKGIRDGRTSYARSLNDRAV